MTKTKKMNYGKIVRRSREGLGLSQAIFSQEIGISQSHLSLIECGKRRVSLEILEVVSDLVGVEVWELLKNK